MTQSLSIRELTEKQYSCSAACSQLQTHTKFHLVWALSTALKLQSIELPSELRCPGKKTDQITVVTNPDQRYRLHGIRPVAWSQRLDTVLVDGLLRCTSPLCTWAMASTRLDLQGLVVLGDSMMRRDPHLKKAKLSDFAEYLESMSAFSHRTGRESFRGFTNCCRALRLMRENTDSSQETRTRLALMRFHLPCPEVNDELDIRGQQFFLDMAYPQYRVCIEYDGEFHSFQWREDSYRRQAIEDSGWKYVQVTSRDLRSEESRERLAVRVADRIRANIGEKRFRAIARQLWDPAGRIRPWTVKSLADRRRFRQHQIRSSVVKQK